MRHADFGNLSANAKWPKQALQKAKTNSKHKVKFIDCRKNARDSNRWKINRVW